MCYAAGLTVLPWQFVWKLPCPPPDNGIGFGIIPEMLEHLLHEHSLANLSAELPLLPDLPGTALSAWGSLPIWEGIYRESDIDGVPGVPKGAEGPSWRPCTPTLGPVPFWATLRPE